MSPETILIKRVKTQNGIFTTKRILVDNIDGTGNISSIDNIKDILINTKINIKKERKNMRLDEIKNSLDQGTKTPEEMAAMIIAYLNEMASGVDGKLGAEIDNEQLMLKTIITSIKNSNTLSSEYKERCVALILSDLKELEEQLEEITTEYEKLEEEINEHNIKTDKRKKYKKILTIATAVVAVAATAVVAFNIYRKFNPSPIELDMSFDGIEGSDLLS